MTREELDNTFTKYKPTLMRLALKQNLSKEDAEDMITETYLVACGRVEYQSVPSQFIRSWWCYQLRDEIRKFKKRTKEEKKALSGLVADPTVEKDNRELSALESLQVLEAQWNNYSRSKQCRIRAQWEEEGIELLDCMKRRPPVAF